MFCECHLGRVSYHWTKGVGSDAYCSGKCDLITLLDHLIFVNVCKGSFSSEIKKKKKKDPRFDKNRVGRVSGNPTFFFLGLGIGVSFIFNNMSGERTCSPFHLIEKFRGGGKIES